MLDLVEFKELEHVVVRKADEIGHDSVIKLMACISAEVLPRHIRQALLILKRKDFETATSTTYPTQLDITLASNHRFENPVRNASA
jgi:hypothetical protein